MKRKKRIWWMFIYKMKLHDINEYFGSKPHICSLPCMYHHASRLFAFSKADRVPCTHNLFACSWCSSVFSHMLSSSLSTYFFFFSSSLLIAFFPSFAGRIRCLYFRHPDHWETQGIQRRKKIDEAKSSGKKQHNDICQ